MKKKIAIILCAISVIGLIGCGKKVCDFCDEKKKCETIEFLGEELNICDDCKEDLESLGF